MKQEKRKIYVVALSTRKGAWLTVNDKDVSTLSREINKKLGSPKEIAIHDHQGFGGYGIDEFESLDTIVALSTLMDEYGSGAVAAFASHYGYGDPENLASEFSDRFVGVYESEEAFVEELYQDQIAALPEWVQDYVDIDKLTTDLFAGDYFSSNIGVDSVAVFSAR